MSISAYDKYKIGVHIGDPPYIRNGYRFLKYALVVTDRSRIGVYDYYLSLGIL